MPRIFLLLTVVALLVPGSASADTPYCTCYNDAGDDVPSVNPTDFCSTACGSDASAVMSTESGGYCVCADSSVDVFSCGSVCTSEGYNPTPPVTAPTAPTAPATPTTTPKKLITPTLSVEIPDLKFTDAVIDGGVISANFLGEYIAAVYKYLLGISVTIAIVMVMISGLEWSFSGGSIMGTDNKASASRAQTRIRNALTGLVLLLSTYLILYTVNPNLITLKPVTLENIPTIHLPNETLSSFEDYDWEVVARVGNGTGWNGVPIYNQKSYDSTPYGVCGTVKTSGCGVTSFAMVASFLSGSSITPDQVAKRFADEGFRACPADATEDANGDCQTCQGTKAAAFYNSTYMSELGLIGRTLSTTQSAIQSALTAGELVIISYRTKSGGGHYVVLVGVDSEGYVLVNDPLGGVKQRRTWTQITSTIKSATAIKKN